MDPEETTTTTPAPEPAPAPQPTPAPAPAPAPEPADPHQRSAGVRRIQPAPAPAPAPVGRFRSIGEFVRAAATGDVTIEERGRFYRALSAAASSDAPGLFGQETWINEIIDLRRSRTPALSLFSQRPLPPKGMTINQPTIIQRPLVGVQPGELQQIPSRKLKIGNASWDVATYAGGQETSIQLIERSDPSYLSELYRLYVIEMDLDLEADVAAAILDASNDTHSAEEITTGNGQEVDAFINAAALLLGAATIQSPPEVLALSVDMWKLLAKTKDSTYRPLFPALNPMNAQGSMSLTNVDTGSIMNLSYAIVPSWSGKVAVMGVRDAFRTMVGPMNTMQADIPETLAKGYAVYEDAAFGAVDTAGLVKIIDS